MIICIKKCSCCGETYPATDEYLPLAKYSSVAAVELTKNIAVEFLDYDRISGVFTWKHRGLKWFKSVGSWKSWNTRYAGTVVGATQSKGYLFVSIFKKRYFLHRIAWLYLHGFFPECQIDHIDGNKKNNSESNLRLASNQENSRNEKLRTNNTSGHLGVVWEKRTKRWVAQAMVDGRNKYLGSYLDINDAIAARDRFNKEYGFHRNHGRR